EVTVKDSMFVAVSSSANSDAISNHAGNSTSIGAVLWGRSFHSHYGLSYSGATICRIVLNTPALHND
ncbi:MAG: hypothetical protein ABJA60_08720, partial [Nitrosospira sp.]